MKEIKIVAMVAFFALESIKQPTRFETLASLIDVWGEQLQEALDILVKDELVISVVVGPHPYYIAVPMARAPLIPDIPEWLYCFHDAYPLSVPGDTQANTFASCGIVLLAAVLTDSRDAELLENLLRLPQCFIALVLRLADAYQFWWSAEIRNLERAVDEDPIDFAEISVALHSLNEKFVSQCCAGAAWTLLHALRAENVFGGFDERLAY